MVIVKISVMWSCLFVFSSWAMASDTASHAPLETLNVNGEQVDMSAYRGRIVYLDFWASWCGPCRESFPWMNKLVREYPTNQLAVIAINLDEDLESANAFLQRFPADFDVLFDPSGTSATQLDVEGMPMSFLIGADGVIHERIVGFSEKRAQKHEQDIKQLINALDRDQ